MTTIMNALVMLYVLYKISAPLIVYVIVITVLVGDLVMVVYRVGEENGKDRE